MACGCSKKTTPPNEATKAEEARLADVAKRAAARAQAQTQGA